MNTAQNLKNLAIVAHVDHGKTTLVDGLLKQSGSLNDRVEAQDRVMDSGELEKERGITISAKNCAIIWDNTKINLLDTPGHADFGGEVERSLLMVDGILLLVDAAEGPLPQTRFVLQKALESGKKVAVFINKVDRPDRRVEEVKTEVEDLFLELATILGLEDFDLDVPFMYGSAKEGWASENYEEPTKDLSILLDFMKSDFYPSPQILDGEGTQFLVTNLSYSPYLGTLLIGRIARGEIRKNDNYTILGKDNTKKNFKVSSVQIFSKLGVEEAASASAGEIAVIAGLDKGFIGDTVCSQDSLDALPRIDVEPPTVSVNVSVSTSPLSGKDGEYLTSRKLEEYLDESCKLNVSLQYEETDDPKVLTLKGRGELQLGIVFEELRRKGYEFMLARPKVVFKIDEKTGEKLEPFEIIVCDIPEDCTGTITEKLSQRKGQMQNLFALGEGRSRLEFLIPSRGLIGLRSQFLTDTRGEGLMSSYFAEYRPFLGTMLARVNGAIISDRKGKSTPYALFNLLSLGKQFIRPGEEVYEGMILGEHTKSNDTNVNCCREKHLSSMRTAGKDQNIIIPPIQDRTLDWAMSWIDDDEWIEVTPKTIRIRKVALEQNKRSVIRKGK